MGNGTSSPDQQQLHQLQYLAQGEQYADQLIQGIQSKWLPPGPGTFPQTQAALQGIAKSAADIQNIANALLAKRGPGPSA
jgi:hypothetical protein